MVDIEIIFSISMKICDNIGEEETERATEVFERKYFRSHISKDIIRTLRAYTETV